MILTKALPVIASIMLCLGLPAAVLAQVEKPDRPKPDKADKERASATKDVISKQSVRMERAAIDRSSGSVQRSAAVAVPETEVGIGITGKVPLAPGIVGTATYDVVNGELSAGVGVGGPSWHLSLEAIAYPFEKAGELKANAGGSLSILGFGLEGSATIPLGDPLREMRRADPFHRGFIGGKIGPIP
jgi:hypothetical protein